MERGSGCGPGGGAVALVVSGELSRLMVFLHHGGYTDRLSGGKMFKEILVGKTCFYCDFKARLFQRIYYG